MIIKTKNGNVDVNSVMSTKIIRNGKTFPALKFIFPDKVLASDIYALTSGEININGYKHNGYNTLDEVSVIVGKVTTAEQERDAIQAKHEETLLNVNRILPVLDDVTALTVKSLFPVWEIGKLYTVGTRLVYGDMLYKVITEHTSQADWTPDVSPSLFTAIDESHAGTIDDPIPYGGNMTLENGKYYVQGDVIYMCIRDTVNPVHHALADLVGQYTELVE